MSIPEFPDHRLKVRRERRQKERKAAAAGQFKLGVLLVIFVPAWVIGNTFVALEYFGESWCTAKVVSVLFAIGLPPTLLGLWLLWKPRGQRRKAELIKRLAREGRLEETREDPAREDGPSEDSPP